MEKRMDDKRMSWWIPEEYAKPDKNRYVLVTVRDAYGDADVEEAFYTGKRWEKRWGSMDSEVTHWMPYPAPAEDEL